MEHSEPTKKSKNQKSKKSTFHRIWMIPIDSGRQNRRGIRCLRSWGQKNGQQRRKTGKIPKNIQKSTLHHTRTPAKDD